MFEEWFWLKLKASNNVFINKASNIYGYEVLFLTHNNILRIRVSKLQLESAKVTTN
jgi:hypothetical protein